VLADPDAPASTRVQAADTLLDHAIKAIGIEDVEVRMAQLERIAGL
jgi:hypothetical protein